MGLDMSIVGSRERYETFIRLFIRWLETYGELVKVIGEMEQSSGKTFEELAREFTKPEVISEIIEKIPASLAGKFFALFLEISRLMSKDIRRLKPEEKVELGKKLIETSKELEKLVFEEIPKYIPKEEKQGD